MVHLEEFFLDKFSTVGELPKTRGDLTNVKQRDDEPLLEYWRGLREFTMKSKDSVKILLLRILKED